MIANILNLQAEFFVRLLLFTSVAMLGVSCGNRTSQEERIRSIVESAPNCRAPCWRGILPGRSSRAEFVSLVEESPERSFADLDFIENAVWRGYEWEDRVNDLFVSMHVENEQVGPISFQPRRELLLESVFATMDTPESYSAVRFPGEQDFVIILLAYPNAAMVVEVLALWHEIDTGGCSFPADESMRVSEIYLTQPDSAENLMAELKSSSAYAQFNAFPWPEDGYLEAQECP